MYTRFFLLHITLYHISVIYCISVIYRLSVIYSISVIYHIYLLHISYFYRISAVYCRSVIYHSSVIYRRSIFCCGSVLYRCLRFQLEQIMIFAQLRAWIFNWYIYRDCLKNKAKDVASLLLLIPHKRFVANRFWTAGVQLKSNQTLKCYLRMGKNPNSILRGSILINTNVIPIERIQGNPW